MDSSSQLVRLHKYIADCGVTSRRKAEDMITWGKVEVNGELVKELGTKIDPAQDVVTVEGNIVNDIHLHKIYVLLHKPRCTVTTLNDPEGRPTVMDLIYGVSERIYPVGRLDYLSEGLLLLTNDGDLANQIMHPSHQVSKTYEVKVFGAVTEEILKTLRKGVYTEVGFLKPETVRVIEQLPNKTWLEFRLGEGKNREIRRLCEAVGMTVDKLRRVSIGSLTIDGIAPGKYRYMTKKQILEAIGTKAPEYWSGKKTVNLKKRGPQATTAATDKAFLKFRRDEYFETVKKLQVKRAELEIQKTTETFAAKEEAHQKRQFKKNKRITEKEEEKRFSHARFV